MSLRNITPPKTKIVATGTSSGSSKPRTLLSSSALSGEEEPWTSTVPSSLHLTFPESIVATHLALSFQGGFAASAASVWVARAEDSSEDGVGLGLIMGGKVFPEDKNRRQVFEIPIPPTGLSPKTESSGLNIFKEAPGQSPLDGNANGAASQTDGNVDGADKPKHLTEIKIEFEKSSDQYGRIALYSLEILCE